LQRKTSLKPPSKRVGVGRYPERGRYDFKTIAAILDEGLVCHVGFVIDGQPFVIPTTYARLNKYIYIHGSPLARWLRTLRDGVPVCVTVSLLDELVLARSALRHSMNYRSVVALGRARAVEEREEKRAALKAIVEHMTPGRWNDGIRHPSESELKATLVLKIPLDEASAKIRTGPPKDLDGDLGRRVWAGRLPLVQVPGEPVPDAGPDGGIETPVCLSRYRGRIGG
jgi:uncharacterized protein